MIKEQIFLYQFILQIDNLMLYFEKKNYQPQICKQRTEKIKVFFWRQSKHGH